MTEWGKGLGIAAHAVASLVDDAPTLARVVTEAASALVPTCGDEMASRVAALAMSEYRTWGEVGAAEAFVRGVDVVLELLDRRATDPSILAAAILLAGAALVAKRRAAKLRADELAALTPASVSRKED